MSGTTQRRRIVGRLVHEIKQAGGAPVTNEKLERILKLRRQQVRQAVLGYMRSHTDVVESAPYVYTATSEAVEPISAQPATLSLDADPTAGIYRHIGEFSDGEVLLQDHNKDLWRARKL